MQKISLFGNYFGAKIEATRPNALIGSVAKDIFECSTIWKLNANRNKLTEKRFLDIVQGQTLKYDILQRKQSKKWESFKS